MLIIPPLTNHIIARLTLEFFILDSHFMNYKVKEQELVTSMAFYPNDKKSIVDTYMQSVQVKIVEILSDNQNPKGPELIIIAIQETLEEIGKMIEV